MKAKHSLVLTIIILISLATVTSCASSTSNEVESLKNQIESLQQENDKLKDEKKTDKEQASDTQEETSENAPETTSEFTAASLDQNIVIEDVCEFAITGIEFGDKIEPQDKDGVYSYYEIDDSSNTYADVGLSLKNLDVSSIEPDDVVSVTLKYSEKYEYTCFIIGESDQGFTYGFMTSIKPLSTATLHCLFEVPDEVATSSDSLECIVKVDGTKYLLVLR